MEQLSEFVINHWILVTAFCGVLGLLIANLLSGAGGLTPLQAVELINREDALVLDVRTTGDFEAGHITNALNVPVADLEGARDKLGDTERPLIVCCASGTTAVGAVRRLRGWGFSGARTLSGGINAWRSANLPLTK